MPLVFDECEFVIDISPTASAEGSPKDSPRQLRLFFPGDDNENEDESLVDEAAAINTTNTTDKLLPV